MSVGFSNFFQSKKLGREVSESILGSATIGALSRLVSVMVGVCVAADPGGICVPCRTLETSVALLEVLVRSSDRKCSHKMRENCLMTSLFYGLDA